ncbi:hypothetical protein QJQ45_020284 [Haematococcus lacustris]|nr:hypothetical protein QJQ45_020284 [Haematococcus lacustris]
MEVDWRSLEIKGSRKPESKKCRQGKQLGSAAMCSHEQQGAVGSGSDEQQPPPLAAPPPHPTPNPISPPLTHFT